MNTLNYQIRTPIFNYNTPPSIMCVFTVKQFVESQPKNNVDMAKFMVMARGSSKNASGMNMEHRMKKAQTSQEQPLSQPRKDRSLSPDQIKMHKALAKLQQRSYSKQRKTATKQQT